MSQTKPQTLAKSIRIVGLAITTNEKSAQADIGGLWMRAGAAGLLRHDAANYGVYKNYQGDRHGEYTVVVGSESEAKAKDDQVVCEIPAAEYQTWSGEGPAAQVAGQAWTHVWQNLDDKRAYTLDFERHEGSPEHTKMSLYIATK